MYMDWGPPHLSLVVCYILHLLIPLPCKTWYYDERDKNFKNLVLDVIRTLGTSNQAIYYNLQKKCSSSLIDLDTLTIKSPTIDAPNLWIRPLCLVPLNLAYGLLYITMGRLYIPVIILHLSTVINLMPPAYWSTFWKSTFKRQLGCKFDIMDCMSPFFILTYATVYVLIYHITFRLYLYFLNNLYLYQVLLY